MDSTNAKAIELWNNTWTPETHTTEYAAKRIKSAQSAKLTPIKIDHEDLYGYFQGSHGRYETFLNYCPCGDFHRSKLPCKHIYRLAMELNIIDNSGMDSNSTYIPIPSSERKILLASLIDILEKGGIDVMEHYTHFEFQFDNTLYLIDPTNAAYAYLIKNKFICISNTPNENLFFRLKKSDILSILAQHGIHIEKTTFPELKTILLSKYADQLDILFPDRKLCFLNPEHASLHKSIYSYCKRVIDPYAYLSNCEIEYSISLINSNGKCHYVIPDTEINRLYLKNGHTFDENIDNNPYTMSLS